MKSFLRLRVISAAKSFPGLFRALLSFVTLFHRLWIVRPQWLLVELANTLNYRLEVLARLTNGMRINVIANDIVGDAICNYGFFEPESIVLYKKILGEGSVFLDIGAQVGQFTLLASGLVGARGRVVSFEPDPTTFTLLKRNIKLNQLRNVLAVQGAVSNVNETREFHLSCVRNIGANSLRPPAQGLETGAIVKVNCRRLDDFLKDNLIPNPDFIKIDVEGAELLVLDGAKDTLSGADRPLLIVEFCEITLIQFGVTCELLASRLTSFKYKLMVVGEFPLKPYIGPDPQGRAINVLAIPIDRVHLFVSILK